MAYATQDDLTPARLTLTQLLQLTTEAGAEEPDASVVQDALDRASSVVDGYCGTRYTTPLQSSELAKSLTIDIAIYFLYSNRGQVKAGTARAVDYNNAIALLTKISEGSATLDVPANAQPQTSSAEVLVTQMPQVFTPRFGCDEDGWL